MDTVKKNIMIIDADRDADRIVKDNLACPSTNINPTYYWRRKGTNRGGSKSTLEPCKWGHTTVKKHRSRVYSPGV